MFRSVPSNKVLANAHERWAQRVSSRVVVEWRPLVGDFERPAPAALLAVSG